MQDTRGEIYRGWLIVLTALEDMYFFYEIHSPEGYINQNLKPFESPEEAIASGQKDIDGVIQLFYESYPESANDADSNSVAVSSSTGGEKK